MEILNLKFFVKNKLKLFFFSLFCFFRCYSRLFFDRNAVANQATTNAFGSLIQRFYTVNIKLRMFHWQQDITKCIRSRKTLFLHPNVSLSFFWELYWRKLPLLAGITKPGRSKGRIQQIDDRIAGSRVRIVLTSRYNLVHCGWELMLFWREHCW